MKVNPSVYDQAVDITEDYLGPAAKRFLDRQILAHLGKEPEDLSRADLVKLIVWLEAAVAVLTDDKQTITEYIDKLNKLIKRVKNAGQKATRRS